MLWISTHAPTTTSKPSVRTPSSRTLSEDVETDVIGEYYLEVGEAPLVEFGHREHTTRPGQGFTEAFLDRKEEKLEPWAACSSLIDTHNRTFWSTDSISGKDMRARIYRKISWMYQHCCKREGGRHLMHSRICTMVRFDRQIISPLIATPRSTMRCLTERITRKRAGCSCTFSGKNSIFN